MNESINPGWAQFREKRREISREPGGGRSSKETRYRKERNKKKIDRIEKEKEQRIEKRRIDPKKRLREKKKCIFIYIYIYIAVRNIGNRSDLI